MNTQLTLSNAKVNDGKVQSSERPVFVGITKVADSTNGRLVNTSVTIDRDWLWVRFSSTPSESWRGKLTSNGFTYSRKRGGWHVLVDESKCKFVQELGAMPVTMERVAQVATQSVLEREGSMILNRQDEIDVDMSEDKAKGKRHQETEARIKERRSKPAEPKQKVATPPAFVGDTKMMATVDKLLNQVAELMEENRKQREMIEKLVAKLVA